MMEDTAWLCYTHASWPTHFRVGLEERVKGEREEAVGMEAGAGVAEEMEEDEARGERGATVVAVAGTRSTLWRTLAARRTKAPRMNPFFGWRCTVRNASSGAACIYNERVSKGGQRKL